MTALRRKTTIRGRPMKPLDLNVMCDQCTTRCTCDIPDFSPGNGNKARRRAEALTKSCQQPQAHPARCGCEQKP